MARILALLALVVGTMILCASVPVPAHAEGDAHVERVTFPDCGKALCVVPRAALEQTFDALDAQKEEIVRLRGELEAERASKTKRCAVVAPEHST